MKFGLFGFVRRNKIKIDISSVNINYKGMIHTLNGIKANKEFVYRMPFTNKEQGTIRVLSIAVSEPFALVKLNFSLPKDIEPGQKVEFELRCRYEKDYSYEGPLKVSVDALPLPKQTSN
ncbi:MAG: hypothetical protein ACP5MK_02775 [Candidatus Micrarchaeia archaeon]